MSPTVFRFRFEQHIASCAQWGRTPIVRSLGVTRIVFHRCGPGFAGWSAPVQHAEDVARAYGQHPELRGPVGRMPYHFFIRSDGVVQQAVLLRMSTPHARLFEYNHGAIAIGVHGDFRELEPTPEQFHACCELTAALMAHFAKPLRVSGHHPDLPGSSSDPHKVCPGPNLDIDAIDVHARQAVLRGEYPSIVFQE